MSFYIEFFINVYEKQKITKVRITKINNDKISKNIIIFQKLLSLSSSKYPIFLIYFKFVNSVCYLMQATNQNYDALLINR